eukprot:Nk52_evm11s236 gene=Nk52_evmTU11s236
METNECQYGAHFSKHGRVEWKTFKQKPDSMAQIYTLSEILPGNMDDDMLEKGISGEPDEKEAVKDTPLNEESSEGSVEHENLDGIFSSEEDDGDEITHAREVVDERTAQELKERLYTVDFSNGDIPEGVNIHRRSPSELYLASKYENKDEERIGEFENLSQNIYNLYEDIVECVKRTSQVREVKDGKVVMEDPFVPKYNSGGCFYYDEDSVDNIKVQVDQAALAQVTSKVDSDKDTITPSQFLYSLTGGKRRRRVSKKLQKVVLNEHPSLSTLKRRDEILRCKRQMPESTHKKLEGLMDNSQNEQAVLNDRNLELRKRAESPKQLTGLRDSASTPACMQSIASELLKESAEYRESKGKMPAKDIVAQALQNRKDDLNTQIQELDIPEHKKQEMAKFFQYLDPSKLHLSAISGLSSLMKVMQQHHYQVSKNKAQKYLYNTKVRKLQGDKRMVKSALVSGKSLNDIQKAQLDEKKGEKKELEKKKAAFLPAEEYPEPIKEDQLGVHFPLTPLKWCGNADVKVERMRRRVAVRAHKNRAAGAHITKALQAIHEQAEKAEEKRKNTVGLFGTNYFNAAKSVKKKARKSMAVADKTATEIKGRISTRKSDTKISTASLAEARAIEEESRDEEINELQKNNIQKEESFISKEKGFVPEQKPLNHYWRELRTLVTLLGFKNPDEKMLKMRKNDRIAFLTESLENKNDEIRLSAARALKFLDARKPDSIKVLHKRALYDKNQLIRYECVKTLLVVGSWTSDCLEMFVRYLRKGSSYVKVSLLKTAHKNRKLSILENGPGYGSLLKCLLELSDEDTDEEVRFNSIVLLAILSVYDRAIDSRIFDTAKENLMDRLSSDSVPERRYISARILTKYMNIANPELLTSALTQISEAKRWKFRREAAEMVCVLHTQYADSQSAFQLLVKSLWEEPHKEVKIAVVATISKLGMAPQAFEYVFKQLQHRDNMCRCQAVKCLVTMGIKNETTLMALLDMIELDSSKVVRITAIKALVTLQFTDRRVYKSLKERSLVNNEATDLDVADAARKALEKLF